MGKKSSPIIVIEKELLRSKAWRSLRKGSSAVVYTHFLMKRVLVNAPGKRGKNRKIIANNGKIEFPYSEALKLGLSRQRFRDALKEIVEKGFIDITHSGGGFDGDKSKYAIVERWLKYDTPEFEHKTFEKDIRQGRGYAVVHGRKQKATNDKIKSKPKLIRRKNLKSSMNFPTARSRSFPTAYRVGEK